MNKVETSLELINKVNYAILLSKSDIYPYEDGKRVSDTRTGIKLTIALQNNRLTQISVKFPDDPIPKITDEMIASATASCKFLYIKIPDCSVTLYNSNTGFIMTAKAETAQIVQLNG